MMFTTQRFTSIVAAVILPVLSASVTPGQTKAESKPSNAGVLAPRRPISQGIVSSDSSIRQDMPAPTMNASEIVQKIAANIRAHSLPEWHDGWDKRVASTVVNGTTLTVDLTKSMWQGSAFGDEKRVSFTLNLDTYHNFDYGTYHSISVFDEPLAFTSDGDLRQFPYDPGPNNQNFVELRELESQLNDLLHHRSRPSNGVPRGQVAQDVPNASDRNSESERIQRLKLGMSMQSPTVGANDTRRSSRTSSGESPTNAASSKNGARSGRQILKDGEFYTIIPEAYKPKYEGTWSQWAPTNVPGIQWRYLGPVAQGFNAINNETGKKSFWWAWALKNTSNNMIGMKYEISYGGQPHQYQAILQPGQEVEVDSSAQVTFSDSRNINFRLLYLETCSAVKTSKPTPYGASQGYQCQN